MHSTELTQSQIHLAKTLCAMRWIALLTGKHDVAKAIERDMQATESDLVSTK